MPFLETHVYTGLKILNSRSPYFIVGLCLPDIVEFTDYIDEEETHSKGQEFFDWVKENGYKELLPLAAGVLIHEKSDYAAEKDHNGCGKGFVFIGTDFNMEHIVKSIGPVAHKFPEVKIDAFIAYQNPELKDIIKASFEQVNLDAIATCLSDFYKKDKQKMKSIIQKYFETAQLYIDWLKFVKYLSPLVPYNKQYERHINESIENILGELRDELKEHGRALLCKKTKS